MDQGVRDLPIMALDKLHCALGPDVVPTVLAKFPVELIRSETVGHAVSDLLGKAYSTYLNADWNTCLRHCDVILDVTWEQLNTGYWKDVDISWRYVYTTASWMKALAQFANVLSDGSNVKDAVKTCDMGLLMGAPVRDNVLSTLASKLQKMYSARPITNATDTEPVCKKPKLINVPAIEKPVGVVCNPSLEYFRTKHMLEERPVIVANAMNYWPAMAERRWSVHYIKTVAGCRTVPVEVGSKYTEEDWSQSLMTVEEFVEKFIESPSTDEKGYLAQHQLFNQVPELQKDIHVPSYCGLSEDDDGDVDINAWFGPEGTVSPLHQDPKHNLLCQVVGEKYIRLYAAEYTDMVYPHESRLLSNTSRVDVENPDLVRFPDFIKAPYSECILRPGQMLYIPPKCWHYIRSLSVSFSISFWWR